MKTNTKHLLKREQGFTLVEVIAVLIILGILAAVAVPKYINLEEDAKKRAIDAAVSEINGRESMTWAQIKISTDSATMPATDPLMDTAVWTKMMADTGLDLNVGTGTKVYVWKPEPPTKTKPSLQFQSSDFYELEREPATLKTPAIWKRTGLSTKP